LDISSSCTGFAVFDNEKLLKYGAYKMTNKNKFPDFYAKCDYILSELKKLKEYNIEYIYIETPLKSFRSGFSSANTLTALSRMNGMVSWICYHEFNIKPVHIEAKTSRSLNKIKIPKNSNVKEEILKYVSSSEKFFQIEYTKNNNPKSEFFDIADAIVIAKAGYLIQNS
jgi:hypothetical protein